MGGPVGLRQKRVQAISADTSRRPVSVRYQLCRLSAHCIECMRLICRWGVVITELVAAGVALPPPKIDSFIEPRPQVSGLATDPRPLRRGPAEPPLDAAPLPKSTRIGSHLLGPKKGIPVPSPANDRTISSTLKIDTSVSILAAESRQTSALAGRVHRDSTYNQGAHRAAGRRADGAFSRVSMASLP